MNGAAGGLESGLSVNWPAVLTAAVGIVSLWLNWRRERRERDARNQLHRDTLNEVRRAVADIPPLRQAVHNHELQLGLVWNEARAQGFKLPESRPRSDMGGL